MSGKSIKLEQARLLGGSALLFAHVFMPAILLCVLINFNNSLNYVSEYLSRFSLIIINV